jgi:hypothetical protein
LNKTLLIELKKVEHPQRSPIQMGMGLSPATYLMDVSKDSYYFTKKKNKGIQMRHINIKKVRSLQFKRA